MTRDDHDDSLDDDDLRLGPLPAPDAAADAAERARARAFGDLVDKVLTGKPPAVVPAEDRALLEVATALRAAVRPVELAAAKQRSIVEGALATAIERRGGGAGLHLTDRSIAVMSASALGPRQASRWRRAAPWTLAGVSTVVAAAAVAMLLVGRRPVPTARRVDTAAVPAQWRSRPADALIGAIPREASGDALGRIETIYADRLAGYRERTFAQHHRSGGKP